MQFAQCRLTGSVRRRAAQSPYALISANGFIAKAWISTRLCLMTARASTTSPESAGHFTTRLRHIRRCDLRARVAYLANADRSVDLVTYRRLMRLVDLLALDRVANTGETAMKLGAVRIASATMQVLGILAIVLRQKLKCSCPIARSSCRV